MSMLCPGSSIGKFPDHAVDSASSTCGVVVLGQRSWDLGQHRVEADADACSMTAPYLMGSRERALIRSSIGLDMVARGGIEPPTRGF